MNEQYFYDGHQTGIGRLKQPGEKGVPEMLREEEGVWGIGDAAGTRLSCASASAPATRGVGSACFLCECVSIDMQQFQPDIIVNVSLRKFKYP